MLDLPRALGVKCPLVHYLQILPFVQDFGDARLSKQFIKPKDVLCPFPQVHLGHARHGIALLPDCKLFRRIWDICTVRKKWEGIVC